MSTKKSTSKPLTLNRPSLLKKHITHPKLIVFLLILLALPAFSFAYNKYKDWDNAQFIKGLARDFPALVEEMKKTTGLELKAESSCSTTQEKYGDGVRTCEFTVGYRGQDNIEQAIKNVPFIDKGFEIYEGGWGQKTGVRMLYRSKKSCSLWFASSDRFHMSCVIGVRDANVDLARELFR